MAEQKWAAKVRPELHPAAAELVAIYEAVPGALTYPGCCPEGLAKVVYALAAELRTAPDLRLHVSLLMERAALLQGIQP